MNSIGQTVFELESGNENVDGQTDVRHINLIGGLVTRNQPKNSKFNDNEVVSDLLIDKNFKVDITQMAIELQLWKSAIT